MGQVAGFLTAVEGAFSISEDDSQTASVLESLIVSPARDKALKQTKSWSTNCLIRLYHSHSSLKQDKGVTTLPMFIKQVRESQLVQNWMQEASTAAPEISWRIEDSGYLTHINMKKTDQSMTDEDKTQKKQKGGKKKGAAKQNPEGDSEMTDAAAAAGKSNEEQKKEAKSEPLQF